MLREGSCWSVPVALQAQVLTTDELYRAAKRLNVELRENVAGPWPLPRPKHSTEAVGKQRSGSWWELLHNWDPRAGFGEGLVLKKPAPLT